MKGYMGTGRCARVWGMDVQVCRQLSAWVRGVCARSDRHRSRWTCVGIRGWGHGHAST